VHAFVSWCQERICIAIECRRVEISGHCGIYKYYTDELCDSYWQQSNGGYNGLDIKLAWGT
jgi:hypothetical protein